jgi:uncharacterized LabA/DUF88 family protein
VEDLDGDEELRPHQLRLRLETLLADRDARRPRREQKGVDTLLALDLVRLASEAAAGQGPSTIVLLTGDGDFCPAVQAAQRLGARVFLLLGPGPAGQIGLSGKLRHHADGEIVMDDAAFRQMYTTRRGR